MQAACTAVTGIAMKTCPFCASQIADAASVCPHCTRDLPRTGPDIDFWAKLITGALLVGGLAYCATTPPSSPVQRTVVSAPTSVKPLEFAVTPKVEAGKVTLLGRTNLPDDTRLMADITRKELAFMNGGEAMVGQDGSFIAGPYDLNGEPLPGGKYDFSITAPLYDVQSESAKPYLGKDYSNYTGPLKSTNAIGTVLNYEGSITIDGSISKAEERRLRDKRVEEVKSQSRADCKNHPAVIEKYSGQKVSDPAAVIARCIREANKLEAPR